MLPISGAFADANFNFNLNFGKSNNNAPPPAAPSTTNWTGSWNTSWESGTATLYLFQAGYSVTGYYGYKEGIVKGVVEGNTLRGTYTQSNSSGSFNF